MPIKKILLDELIKKGHTEIGGKKIWNLANRSFLQLTPEMSKGFLKVVNYPPYKKNIYDKELDLILSNMNNFVSDVIKNPFNLIDIGCGEGVKAKAFFDSCKCVHKVRYCPVSPDKFMLDKAVETLKKIKGVELSFEPYKSGFEHLSEIGPRMRNQEFPQNVILLHGSILASYEINDYLFKLSNGMIDGDYLVIGNGIRKGERLVEIDKYKDKVFDDWFMPLLKTIGFEKNEDEYDAEFRNNRMESFYKLKVDKNVKHNGNTLEFRKGDEILVFFLYKYYKEELEKFCKMYFCDVKVVVDKDEGYALLFCKK